MLIALHETAAHGTPGKIESLQNPNASHQEHQDTDKAADHPHDSIEYLEQNAPPLLFLTPRNRRECV
jgi:hypothetical protein